MFIYSIRVKQLTRLILTSAATMAPVRTAYARNVVAPAIFLCWSAAAWTFSVRYVVRIVQNHLGVRLPALSAHKIPHGRRRASTVSVERRLECLAVKARCVNGFGIPCADVPAPFPRANVAQAREK